jgi:dTDP-4-dehydrorhamnose reductase
MILILGGNGYIGRAFASELDQRQLAYRMLSRSEVDYSRFDVWLSLLRATAPDFVINAAGYTGKPNVDACELDKGGTIAGNLLLPQTLAQGCEVAGVPWGHVSSGCIYSGAMISTSQGWQACKDLMQPEPRMLRETRPEAIRGYVETDLPNFCFQDPPCSFYSGTKAMAEAAITGLGRNYIWRLRIPFDEIDNPRNYLSKIQNYPRVYDNVNSLSHRRDFVRACLDLWERRAPFGIYNVTNPGFVTTHQVVDLLQARLKLGRAFEYWTSDEEFYRVAAKTPRSNCILDVSKLLATGVKIRPVTEALDEALDRWQPAYPRTITDP